MPQKTGTYTVELALGDSHQDILAKARLAAAREAARRDLALRLATDVLNRAIPRGVARSLMAGALS